MPTDKLITLKATADILGGAVFFADDNGFDPEYPDNGDLLPNGMYIRLEGSDGSIAYISAYELDKAIDVIGQMSMSKASKSDLESVKTLLNDKVSKTDLSDIQDDVDNKVSKTDFNILKSVVEDKADKTEVDNLTNTIVGQVAETVQGLNNSLDLKADKSIVDKLIATVDTKASSNKVADILNDISILSETVNSLVDSGSIEAINAQINSLREELRNKISLKDYQYLRNSVVSLNNSNIDIVSRLVTAEANISKKASTNYVQQQLSEMNNAVTSLAQVVENKASKTEVFTKADKDEFDKVAKKVNRLNSTVENINSNVLNQFIDVQKDIKAKADKTYVDSNLNQIRTNISDIPSRAAFIESVNKINLTLEELKTQHDIDDNDLTLKLAELECELKNVVTTLKNSINTANKLISNNSSNINSMQKTLSTHASQLKQPWVRVISTKEYEKLLPVKDGMTVYNPSYRYPNILYFIVDFNQPKAIYIGNIQIAKAEKRGDVGFTYTFPIVF